MSGERTRRRLLQVTAGLTLGTGLAGCLRDSTDPPDGTGGSNGGESRTTSGPAGNEPETTPASSGDKTRTASTDASAQSGAVPCDAIDNGYSWFEPGAVPSVADFEYPAIFGELEVNASVQMVARGRRKASGSPDAELTFNFTQLTTGYSQSSIQGPGDDDRAIATTVDFNGEEIYVISNPNSPANSVSLQASLPYDIDGETRYFTTNIDLTKTNTKTLAGDCEESMIAGARHLANSLRPNPDSTIGEAET